jgi:hypothetical protein
VFSNLTALSGLQINLNREARIDRGVVAIGVKLHDKLNFEHGSKQNYCPVIKVFELFRGDYRSCALFS